MRVDLALGLATASIAERTITGTATVYGVRGHASVPLVVEAGSLRIPESQSRVKLVIDHDTTQPVGYLVDATDGPERLDVKFHVPPGQAGDQALTDAAHGLRDGLSIGADLDDDGYSLDDDGYVHVTGAVLREVTLCAVPAYDDARVSDVVATLKKGRTMTVELVTPTADVAASGAVSPVAAAPAPPETTATTAAPVAAAATAPAPPAVTASRTMTLRAAAVLIADTCRRGGTAQDVRARLGLTAALADVVPADDAGLGFTRPVWLGELWKATVAARPFIDALGTPSPLTGLKVYGWQWDLTPAVVDYAGNKAEVVGNPVSTKPAEATAERLAGGWDVDRIYVDLGEPGLIEALFSAAADDYKRKTEAKVAAKLVAAATATGGGPFDSLTDVLAAMGTQAASIGANLTAVGFGATVWSAFTGLTRDQVPWWMGSGDSINLGTVDGTVGGFRLFASPNIGANAVIGLDSRAATYYEATPAPLNVQAVDIPHGGVDLGVFGYHALLVNDPRAILSATVTPPVIAASKSKAA